MPDKAVEIDQCPMKFLTADVCDLFRALSLAGGAVPIADQAWLPEPYMQALFVAKTELEAARARRMKERGNG